MNTSFFLVQNMNFNVQWIYASSEVTGYYLCFKERLFIKIVIKVSVNADFYSVCVWVTVQLDDFLQVNEDVFDVFRGQDGVSAQPLVENAVQHLQRPQVSSLSVEQLCGQTGGHVRGRSACLTSTLWGRAAKSPLMTSCRLISCGVRLARTSWLTRLCQFWRSSSHISPPWSSSLWMSAEVTAHSILPPAGTNRKHCGDLRDHHHDLIYNCPTVIKWCQIKGLHIFFNVSSSCEYLKLSWSSSCGCSRLDGLKSNWVPAALQTPSCGSPGCGVSLGLGWTRSGDTSVSAEEVTTKWFCSSGYSNILILVFLNMWVKEWTTIKKTLLINVTFNAKIEVNSW